MITRLLIILFFFSFGTMTGTEGIQQFENANKAYNDKKFDEAIAAYETIIEQGFQSEELYYNLANCYFKKKQTAKAILNYERALIIDPNDEDILHNLNVTRSFLKDDISVIPPFFLARWWGGLRRQLSSTSWGIVGILVLWLGIGGLILWLIGKTRALKKKGFLAGIALVLLSIVPFFLAMNQAKLEKNSSRAIIMKSEIPLRSAPDELSTELILLHEGTKVEILDLIGSWNKVRLENGEQGWLPLDVIEQI